MRVLLCLTVLGGCTYIGVMLGKVYHERVLFFRELLHVIAAMKSNLFFACTDLRRLLTEQANANRQVAPFLRAYVLALEGDVLISPASLAGVLPRCGMREEEYTEAVKLFAALGTSDAQGQEELLLHYEGVFNAFYAEATEAKKKYGALYTKLGIAVGVLLLILLL